MHIEMTRLYEALEDQKIKNAVELARHLSTSHQLVYNWESRGISDRGKLTLQQTFGVSAIWIETGVGSKWMSFSKVVTSGNLLSKKVPLINPGQALKWIETMDLAQAGFTGEFLQTDADVSQKAFYFDIAGDQNYPMFRVGEHVIVDPDLKPMAGDYVLAEADGEAVFAKYRSRTLESGENIFELVPTNPDEEPLRSDTSRLRVMGVMVEHRKYRAASKRMRLEYPPPPSPLAP